MLGKGGCYRSREARVVAHGADDVEPIQGSCQARAHDLPGFKGSGCEARERTLKAGLRKLVYDEDVFVNSGSRILIYSK